MASDRHFDDEDLIRLRHGTEAERAELAALAAGDPVLAERLAAWDRQDRALNTLYGPLSDDPVPTRFTTLLARFDQRRARAFRIAAAVGLIGLGIAGGVATDRALYRPVRQPEAIVQLAMDAFATYSVEIRHPVEVPASDADHLTTWLSNRVGVHLRLPDMSANGFELLGGRIVPANGRVAAVLLYQDDIGRRVTLYVQRADGTQDDALHAVAQGGTPGVWWIDRGLGCVVVGDLPPDVLRAISQRAYQDLTEA